MWYDIDHRSINQILGHGLKIDAEVLSLLHILREHTEKNLKFVKGQLDQDNNTVTRYRIAETVHFTNTLMKWMKRYPQTSYVRDKEYSDAMKRNFEGLRKKLDGIQHSMEEGETTSQPPRKEGLEHDPNPRSGL